MQFTTGTFPARCRRIEYAVWRTTRFENDGTDGKQSGLLLRLYQAERSKDPASRATESSRSNLIALRHTIAQIYGGAEPSVVGVPGADE